MAQTITKITTSAGTWVLVKAFVAPYPKSAVVKNHRLSAEEAEVFLVPMHGDAAPTEGHDGYPLAPGESHSFAGFQTGGGPGHVAAVYARSSGATVYVAVDVG